VSSHFFNGHAGVAFPLHLESAFLLHASRRLVCCFKTVNFVLSVLFAPTFALGQGGDVDHFRVGSSPLGVNLCVPA